MESLPSESDEAFLARLRPPYINKADRARLAKMMAEEARRLGDTDAAERIAADYGGGNIVRPSDSHKKGAGD